MFCLVYALKAKTNKDYLLLISKKKEERTFLICDLHFDLSSYILQSYIAGFS